MHSFVTSKNVKWRRFLAQPVHYIVKFITTLFMFLARGSMYAVVRYMLSPVRPSVRLPVRPSHGWISQKRL